MTHSLIRKSLVGLVAVLCSGVSAGCSSEAPGKTSSLLEQCSGEYECQEPDGEIKQPTLERVDGVCTIDETVTLGEFGEVATKSDGVLPELSWSGDASRFEICGPGGCIECEAQADDAGPQKGGECVGSPRSCSSLGAGTCVLDGCSFDSYVTFDGQIEFECSGSATACGWYRSEGLCEGQTGCRWE